MSKWKNVLDYLRENKRGVGFWVGVVIVPTILVLWLISSMIVEIKPGQAGIVFKKIGDDLPSGETVAPTADHMGIQQEMLTPGWHLINPLWTDVEITNALSVPKGMKALLVRKAGENPKDNSKLIVGENERGVQARLLNSGDHLINPEVYDVVLFPPHHVPEGFVGIVKSNIGKPAPAGSVVVEPGQIGIWRRVLTPGQYFEYNDELGKKKYTLVSLKDMSGKEDTKGYEITLAPVVKVPEGSVGVVTSHTQVLEGEALIFPGDNGPLREVLMPGTYPEYSNHVAYKVEVHPVVKVASDSVGVVTSLAGTQSNAELVAPGEKGIMREVLMPGTYYDYSNRAAYNVEIVPAIEINSGKVGVVRLKAGRLPTNPKAKVVENGERGIQPDTLQPGLHRVNPYEMEIIVVDSRVQKYEMSRDDKTLSAGEVSGDDRLSFPSSDGFHILVDTSIEWQIDPDQIPHVVATIGNTDEIVSKIIRPNAREIGRLEGSKLKASDFIRGEQREQFVTNFSATLQARCAIKGIIINKALVREVLPPPEVATPLKEAEVALLNEKTNEVKEKQIESEAKLAMKQEEVKQGEALTKAETERLVAEKEALREKNVAKIKAEQLKDVSGIEKQQQELILEKQKLQAEGIRELGDAEAHRARALIEADGALQQKLDAWTRVMEMWAQNENLVPNVVVGGGGGAAGGLTGQELIMQLMAIERLEAFSNDAAQK